MQVVCSAWSRSGVAPIGEVTRRVPLHVFQIDTCLCHNRKLLPLTCLCSVLGEWVYKEQAWG